jgi:hypothetical protein
MRKHQFKHSPENDALLVGNVEQQLEAYKGKDLQDTRDRFLQKVQDLKEQLQ